MVDEGTEQFELQITIKNQALIKKLKSIPIRKRNMLILEILEEKLLFEAEANLQTDSDSKLNGVIERIDKIEVSLEKVIEQLNLLEKNNTRDSIEPSSPQDDKEQDIFHNDIVNTVNPENLFNKLNSNFL